MAKRVLSDADFIAEFEKLGTKPLAKKFGMSERGVLLRRAAIEGRIGRQLTSPHKNGATRHGISHPQRIILDIPNGTVVVGSDSHYWPGPASTAHRAFVHFIKEMKPRAVILNGDAFDGATVSRHPPPIDWGSRPSVVEELEACQERLGEIEAATPRGSRRVWNLGNHDARLELRLAQMAPEFVRVAGFSLKDHFPLWEPAWATWINDDVIVKHRWKGGIHAPSNNTLWAGKTMVTGHLHSAKVQPLTDYNGDRYGVDTGCLADIYGPQFTYSEDSPRNWRSGFGLLTFVGGKLLQPELILVWDAEHVQFRGQIIKV